MKTFIKVKLFLTILFMTGCANVNTEGWHYHSFNQNTSPQYIKEDYIISCNYKHFVLFKDGKKINEFETLEEAKKSIN